jgi:hypothetical protein
MRRGESLLDGEERNHGNRPARSQIRSRDHHRGACRDQAGLRYAPYGVVFRRVVRPRLGPPGHTEAEAPPRFSQGVGMVFALGGVLGYAVGATEVGIVFTAFALVAAFLNAAFDFCLGCQAYLLIQRNLKVRPSA